ncbi:MAG: F0F1 ATP synthase subunit A [Chloroflexi bacterium]|nr:MAG: F0F1 ATP synthase subunit A [Chloroflexota bacterium]
MDWLFPRGFKYPPDFHIPSLTGEPLFHVGPLSYTNAHLTMAIVIAILAGLAWFVTRDLRDRPSPLQNLVEILVQGLDDFVVSIGGTGSRKYLPLFGSLFLFIVFSNWLSVLPFIGQVKFLHSPTADYHINFGMALVAWVAYQTEGFRHLKLDYPKRWFNLSGFKDGPVIGAIFILVGFIELFSELFRVLTLTLRLWGNVLGGEIMLIVMSGLFLVPGLALPFVGLEVFIGLVQGLVFALLVLMYFVLAIESHDEEHEEGSDIDSDRVPSPEQHPAPQAA